MQQLSEAFALDFLMPQEQGMLGRAPEEVAKFLAKTGGLNKTMIGEYLGEREEACLRVMHAYVDAMDFAGSEFDTAIRCAACLALPLLPDARATKHAKPLLYFAVCCRLTARCKAEVFLVIHACMVLGLCSDERETIGT
jgi:hypothetical protein